MKRNFNISDENGYGFTVSFVPCQTGLWQVDTWVHVPGKESRQVIFSENWNGDDPQQFDAFAFIQSILDRAAAV